MATGKVIKRTVDALRAAGIDGCLWDEDLKGFGVRTLTSGAATYRASHRLFAITRQSLALCEWKRLQD